MQRDWTCRFTRVKPILQLKKSLNLGYVPDLFHIIVKKLFELEGTFTDGFDNNITYLLNKQNWNTANCVGGKPPVALKKHWNQYAFDLHCFPVIKGEPCLTIKPFNHYSPFKEFNPSSLGPLLSIPRLIEFVSSTIRCGDEADIELLKYAHMLIEQLTTLFNTSLQVTEDTGQSIQEMFNVVEQQAKTMNAF